MTSVSKHRRTQSWLAHKQNSAADKSRQQHMGHAYSSEQLVKGPIAAIASDVTKQATQRSAFFWHHASKCKRYQGQTQDCKGLLSSLAKTLRSDGSLCRVGPAVCANRAPTFRLSRCSALRSSGSCCALPTLKLLPVPALPLQCTPALRHACSPPAENMQS